MKLSAEVKNLVLKINLRAFDLFFSCKISHSICFDIPFSTIHSAHSSFLQLSEFLNIYLALKQAPFASYLRQGDTNQVKIGVIRSVSGEVMANT